MLLAAGGSRRMGVPKQLAPIGGQSLVRGAAETALASRCAALFAVIGAHAEAVGAELSGLDARLVRARDWQSGLGASIRTGVTALAAKPGFDAVIVLLADQPRITGAHLDRLIDAFEHGAELVATAYAGTLGVPALFARHHFGALRELSGDRGAQAWLEAHAEQVECVRFEDAAFDVDTPADLV